MNFRKLSILAAVLVAAYFVYLTLTVSSRRIAAAERAVASVEEQTASSAAGRREFGAKFGWSQLERNRASMIAAAGEIVAESNRLAEASKLAIERIDAVIDHSSDATQRRYWTNMRESLAKRAEAAAAYAEAYTLATSVSVSDRQPLGERAGPLIDRADLIATAADKLSAGAKSIAAASTSR